MKKTFRRFTAAAVSAVLSLSALPLTFNAAAEENYLVRDPFYNYGYGYNYYESEHFQFIWGNSGDSSRVTTEFLEGNAKNLEDCWDVYMTDLEMEAPSQSVNLSLRDGNHYKTNIYISGTGLDGMTDDWAYMSYDSGGFAYMFCCVDSMQYNPPSWVLPHEFGHVVTAHQLGWNSNKYSYAWWEAMGNWFREQYLYSDYSTDETGHGTDFFETYLKNSSLTFPCGRDYYAAWPFLQYLTENPDNLAGYGNDFVKTMLQEGQVDEYPFDMVDRLAEADMKDTLGHFAKHMAGLDFENGDAYRARLNELLSAGSWNWQQIYTMLEPVAGIEGLYKVPTERAPQYAGLNIVPLNVMGSEISVGLIGTGEDENGETPDNWRACIVQQLSDGTCVYSDLFGATNDDYTTVAVEANLSAAYLTVIATPDLDTVTKVGLPYGPDSEFAESNYPFTEKEQYPYMAKIEGAEIKQREVATGTNWWESYHNHSNGGGLVSDSATVDDSVYVGPNAKVLGSATVTGNVRIEDYAVVQDSAAVSENAVISGYAIIAERANISGNVRVDDTALVMGNARISGNAKVIESACVYGDYTMTDNAVAKGMAFCMANGSISGQGVVDGDYYDDGGKTVTKGTAYGWVSAQSYVDSLPYTDKLMYAYDFNQSETGLLPDQYNSTHLLSFATPGVSETAVGASNVMTFRSSLSNVSLDRGILYTDDIDIQIAALPNEYLGAPNSDENPLLFLGNDENYIKILLSNSEGYPEVIFKKGDTVEKLTSSVATDLGAWHKVRVILDGDNGRLVINGETAASGTVTINPSDIASAVSVSDKTAAYRLGADNNISNLFVGYVDYLRIYSSEAADSPEVYTERETVGDYTLVGDLNYDNIIDIYDLILMRERVVMIGSGERYLNGTREFAASDLNGDESIDVSDLVLMNQHLFNYNPYNIEGSDSFPVGVYAVYVY